MIMVRDDATRDENKKDKKRGKEQKKTGVENLRLQKKVLVEKGAREKVLRLAMTYVNFLVCKFHRGHNPSPPP